MTTETITPSQVLMGTLRTHKALSVMNGKWQPVCQTLAQRHSEAQAARDRHDQFYRNYAHAGWGERQIELVSRVPEGKGFAEVCAWAGPHTDEAAAAEAIFASWKGSPDHWVFVNGRMNFWGYAMSQGHSGVWYATGIVAQKR
jgi:hypothetical protein